MKGLNELECVGPTVYANVLPTDRIVRIDPATSAITATIDAWACWPPTKSSRGRR